MYKYETHVHSSPASACGNTRPEDIVDLYLEAGYSGMWLTDHFFNGNTGIDRSLPWSTRVEQFADCFYRAEKRGRQVGFGVFFGLEYAHHGAEFAVYNSSPEYLYNNPDIMERGIHRVLDEFRDAGAFIVHVHPYRNASYIPAPGMRYGGHIDAVEVFNASNAPMDNLPAVEYARECNLIPMSGSDNHNARRLHHAGIAVPKRAETAAELIDQLKERRHRLLTPGYEEIYPEWT